MKKDKKAGSLELTAEQRASLYEYRVAYSPEDECFVAHVTEWPSLGAHGDDALDAMREMRSVVVSCLEDMLEKHEEPPVPHSIESIRLLPRPPLHRPVQCQTVPPSPPHQKR